MAYFKNGFLELAGCGMRYFFYFPDAKLLIETIKKEYCSGKIKWVIK